MPTSGHTFSVPLKVFLKRRKPCLCSACSCVVLLPEGCGRMSQTDFEESMSGGVILTTSRGLR